jgi:hypothetical protein
MNDFKINQELSQPDFKVLTKALSLCKNVRVFLLRFYSAAASSLTAFEGATYSVPVMR